MQAWRLPTTASLAAQVTLYRLRLESVLPAYPYRLDFPLVEEGVNGAFRHVETISNIAHGPERLGTGGHLRRRAPDEFFEGFGSLFGKISVVADATKKLVLGGVLYRLLHGTTGLELAGLSRPLALCAWAPDDLYAGGVFGSAGEHGMYTNQVKHPREGR